MLPFPPARSTQLFCAELSDGADGPVRLDATTDATPESVSEWLINFAADRVLIWDQTGTWWLLDDGGWELSVVNGPPEILQEVVPDLNQTVFEWFHWHKRPPLNPDTRAAVTGIVRRYGLVLHPEAEGGLADRR